jgi:glycosyltransferase involved in cell wall biosynthesis
MLSRIRFPASGRDAGTAVGEAPQPIQTRAGGRRLLPKVLIVGGEDVHARIDLMRGLADAYTLAAAGTSPDLAPEFARAGFWYFRYPLGRGLGPFSDLGALAALWRLLTRLRPQIVHAFDTKPGVYGCLAARLAGAPVVLGTITGLGSLYSGEGRHPRLVRRIYEGLQRLAASQSDLTVFQNRDDRERFVARRIVPAGKAVVIPGSGVPTDVFDPARVSHQQRLQVRASLGIPADALVVTMVSRVIRSKGVEEFVAAAGEVRQRFPESRLLLVGPADRDSVDSFSPDELDGLARQVHWPGPRSDIPQVLAASDLFVLPSYLREGIPRVLLEAASMGLPLITTDWPGCNEVVAEGVNGLLVPARDPAALGRAILSLLARPELRQRFGRLSRQRARERFDLAVVVGQTRSLYQELLARKARRRVPISS